ncbi:hypothetical protein FQN52_005764 [Onygenales sp. PD_12]|nr:hypothetical protein FQN52_005764 [Onygenales sp. PD_12]
MKYTPTSHELFTAKSEAVDNRPSNLMARELHVSGSHWDVKHLRALRVLAFDDMAPEKLVPLSFWRPNGGYLGTIKSRRQPLARQRLDPSNQDEEAYLLTIHGTQLHLVTAYFTADYLRHMQSTTMPVNQFLFVKRSRFYELKEPWQRVEAPKLIIGLFRSIMRSTTLEDKITLQKGARRLFGRSCN